jgi:hypothetical protein
MLLQPHTKILSNELECANLLISKNQKKIAAVDSVMGYSALHWALLSGKDKVYIV